MRRRHRHLNVAADLFPAVPFIFGDVPTGLRIRKGLESPSMSDTELREWAALL